MYNLEASMKTFVILTCILALAGSLHAQEILINEIDVDQTGTDTEEFIELYDGGLGNVPLDSLVLVFFNGSNDLSYWAYDLDSLRTDPQGYFVIGNVPGSHISPGDPSDWIQNGADAIALYYGNDADFPNGTPVSTENLLDAVVYDTDDADDQGLLVLLEAGEPQVNENMNGNKDTESLQRQPDGSGGARRTATFHAGLPTPGAQNPLPIIFSSISAVQIGPTAVELTWTTDTEVNNFGFYVERKEHVQTEFTELPGSFTPGNGTTATPHSYSYTDSTSPDGLLQYRVRQVDLDGTIHYSGIAEVSVTAGVESQQPSVLQLSQNYPNPFNPSTTIEFSVPVSSRTTLEVFNLLGESVMELFHGTAEAGNRYRVEVRADNLSSGHYFYRLQNGVSVVTKKFTVLK
jgi:hypothetical protein